MWQKIFFHFSTSFHPLITSYTRSCAFQLFFSRLFLCIAGEELLIALNQILQQSRLLNKPYRTKNKNGHWSQETGCKVQNQMLTPVRVFSSFEDREKKSAFHSKCSIDRIYPNRKKNSNPRRFSDLKKLQSNKFRF